MFVLIQYHVQNTIPPCSNNVVCKLFDAPTRHGRWHDARSVMRKCNRSCNDLLPQESKRARSIIGGGRQLDAGGQAVTPAKLLLLLLQAMLQKTMLRKDKRIKEKTAESSKWQRTDVFLGDDSIQPRMVPIRGERTQGQQDKHQHGSESNHKI